MTENKHMFKDENDLVVEGGDTEDYSNWDISYEEIPPGSNSNANSETHYTKTKTTNKASYSSSEAHQNRNGGTLGDTAALGSAQLAHSETSSSKRTTRKINPIQPGNPKIDPGIVCFNIKLNLQFLQIGRKLLEPRRNSLSIQPTIIQFLSKYKSTSFQQLFIL